MNIPRFLPLIALLALAPLAPLSGCADAINEDTYGQIKIGMTLEQVQDLLGGEGTREEVAGTSISGAGVGGTSRVSTSVKTYTWSEGKEKIVVEFADGKVLAPPRKIGF